MNHEQYLRKELERNLVKNPCRARTLQRAIIKATLWHFRRNQYGDIELLLSDAVRRVRELSVIGRGTTVKNFAWRMGISKTTARLHLLKLDNVQRNEAKKPFIYTVGKK